MNNYEILELKHGASKAEIKTKFRALCLIYHPDMPTGDSSKFIQIQNAYEELLKGISGVSKPEFSAKKEYKQGSYKFISIKRNSKNYIITYRCSDVQEVEIYGKSGISYGAYDLNCESGTFGLNFSFADMKSAKYEITIKLIDSRGNYAKETYRVKPPLKGIKKLINKLFGI